MGWAENVLAVPEKRPMTGNSQASGTIVASHMSHLRKRALEEELFERVKGKSSLRALFGEEME